MKKIIMVTILAVLVILLFCSCQNTPTAEKTVSAETILKDGIFVKATLIAQAHADRCSPSVAYVLLQNDDVAIFQHNDIVFVPFSKEEAKMIMLTHLQTTFRPNTILTVPEENDTIKGVTSLVVSGGATKCSPSVAYVLMDNGEVKTFSNPHVSLMPFTPAEAKVLMRSKQDGTMFTPDN